MERPPAGLVLDGCEHGCILIAAGAASPWRNGGRTMSNELFAAALGVETPWYVKDVSFDAGKRLLTVAIDFKKGSRFPYEGAEGLHPVHDTQAKRYRHLNFFQHECYLEVRTPRTASQTRCSLPFWRCPRASSIPARAVSIAARK